MSYPRATSLIMPARLDEGAAANIMREAGVAPLEPYPGSSAVWRCRCEACGRGVTPRLDNVRQGHAACAYCAGRAVDPIEAAAVMRARGLEPLGAFPGAARPWRCRCTQCGRYVEPRYATVVKGAGCRYCGNERTRQALTLDAEHAREVMRAAGVEPLEPYPGAGEPWMCRCKGCGQEVSPRYTDVRCGHAGCKWCAWTAGGAKQRICHQDATAVMIARGLEPSEPYPGAHSRWRCRCIRCGAVVTPTYNNIKQGWGGCRTCSNVEQSMRQRGSEADAIADMRAAGLEPVEPFRNVMTPWLSQCRTCGKMVSPLLNNVRRGAGCKWCAKCAVDPRQAVEVMRSAGLEPLIAYPGRNSPWPCRCERCRQTVSPRYGAVSAGVGCRYCNDTAIKPDVAAAAMRAVDLEPLGVYPGALRSWKCRCLKCERIVSPCYSTIQRGGGGCRWCANSGFKSGEDAVVYLMNHPGYGAVKIGITDAAASRVKKHQRHGWETLAAVNVTGEVALAIEAEILDWWRADLGLRSYLGRQEMPQGGWTETVDSMEIDVASTIRRITALAQASCALQSPAPADR